VAVASERDAVIVTPPSSRGSLSIADVLRVEDDPKLPDIREPQSGIPVWLMARNYFHRAVIEALLYAGTSLPRYAPQYRVRDMLKAAALSRWHNMQNPPVAAPVLVVGSGAGVMHRDGRAFDRLTSYFAEVLGRDAWSELGIHLFDVRYALRSPRVTLTAHRRLVDHAQARMALRRAHEEIAAAVMRRAAENAERHLGCTIDGSVLAALSRRVAIEVAGAAEVFRRVRQMQKAHSPRLVLADQSSYGTKALFNAACHDYGIEVIEYQHGVITKAHEAYNLSDVWRAMPDVARALPNEIWLYGPWWGTQINLPVKLKAVGNPHRESSMDQSSAIAPNGEEVLVLGDGIDTAFYESFCADLARVLPNRQIVFRPHPVERQRALERHTGVDETYRLDLSPDIYGAFGRAQWVAAEVSTGLFEAVGTPARPVVIDTPKSRFYLPDSPFARAESAEQLADLISGAKPTTDAKFEAFWPLGWKQRFESEMRAKLDRAPGR